MLHQLEKFSQTSEALPASAFNTIIRKVKKAELRRRSVLQGLGGFVLAMYLLPGKAEAFPAYPTHGSGMPNGLRNDPHIFVSIAPSGEVTIVAHRSEMGTGIKNHAADDHRRRDGGQLGPREVVQADGDEAKYGNQDTDGSRSLRHHIQPAREMGAAVRKMLELAAAKQWGADPSQVEARLITSRIRRWASALSYGELAKAAMALDTPPRDQLRFKEDGEFRYIGKGNVQIVDLHDITTGKAVYGADVSLPGMKYRRDRAPAGRRLEDQIGGRQGGSRRSGRGAHRPASGHAARLEIQAARRRGRRRQEHMGGDPGARRAQDRMGEERAQLVQHQGV